MFTWLVVLILSVLGLIDLVILLLISRGIGIPLIIITQSVGAAWGFWNLRKLDFNLFFFLDAELQKGEPIIRELWDEAIILTGTCLLIFPGFITDFIGIAFLVPQFRFLCLEFLHEN